MLRFKILKKIGAYFSIPILRRISSFLKHYVLGLFKRMDQHEIFFAGAGISFSLLVGIIPLILLVFSFLGNIFNQVTIELQFNNLIDQLIPYPDYAKYIKHLISSRLPEIIEYKTAAGFIGISGLLLTSSWIFTTIRTILNKIFSVNVHKGLLYGLVRDLIMVILLLMVVTISIFVLPTINIINQLAQNFGIIQPYIYNPLWNFASHGFSLILIFILFFAMYYLIPYELIGRSVAAVCAFWATLLWELARGIFGYYINFVLKTNPFYGAFVLMIAIMFWIFYSACLFIVAAEIGQLFRERRLMSVKRKNKKAHETTFDI
jgi:membrane protein